MSYVSQSELSRKLVYSLLVDADRLVEVAGDGCGSRGPPRHPPPAARRLGRHRLARVVSLRRPGVPRAAPGGAAGRRNRLCIRVNLLDVNLLELGGDVHGDVGVVGTRGRERRGPHAACHSGPWRRGDVRVGDVLRDVTRGGGRRG